MNKLLKNPYFIGIYLILVAVALFLLLTLPYGAEIVNLNQYRNPFSNAIFTFFTRLGEPYMWVLSIVLLFLIKEKNMALALTITGLTMMPLIYVLKHNIGVDRPITFFKKQELKDELVLAPNIRLYTGQTSFPSGHTASAFALYSMLAAFYIRRKSSGNFGALSAVLLASLIGFSRIFLVQHFLVDVLAGSVLGLSLAWLGFLLFEKIEQRFLKKKIA